MRGGAWRLGPAAPTFGRQRYRDGSAVLTTTWETDEADLELTDAMAWPWDDRAEDDGGGDDRALLRRLRCLRGEAACAFDLHPRLDFDRAALVRSALGGATIDLGRLGLRLWTSRPLPLGDDRITERFTLRAGEEVWAVLAAGPDPRPWTIERARHELGRAGRYWREWGGRLRVSGPRVERVRRSALTVHLLSYAPTGSPVAAPTSSLPERVGGDRNWDYRYAWVRDASLALAALVRLGDTAGARRYMDCLTTYRSSTESPLQVVYGVDGTTDLPVRERGDLAGYRGSRPVRVGNGA